MHLDHASVEGIFSYLQVSSQGKLKIKNNLQPIKGEHNCKRKVASK